MVETSKDKVNIVGVNFDKISKDKLLQQIGLSANHFNKAVHVVTGNPEIVIRAYEDRLYKDILNKADYVVPDGIGVIWAAKVFHQPLPERIPGYELMLDLLQIANEKKLSCFFLGATEKVIHDMERVIPEQYPHIKRVGFHHGFIDIDNSHVEKAINEIEPDLIFVALGAPKQDLWIDNNMPKFRKGVFIGVGGSFDVLTGAVKRAPRLWIKWHLEWLYRLLQQPQRLKRLPNLLRFVKVVLLEKCKRQ